jgi:hypothetical protein
VINRKDLRLWIGQCWRQIVTFWISLCLWLDFNSILQKCRCLLLQNQ